MTIIMNNSLIPNKLLNAQQLVERSKEIDEFVYVSRGNKIASDDDMRDESGPGRSDEGLENLKKLLRFERILLTKKISKGIYEPDQNRVKVQSHVGKWYFGYFEDKVNYLRPHEALHLMEMSRIEIKFDSVVMSIEQAYAIFLDPCNEVSFEEYLVYSYLCRAGYFVYQHDPEIDYNKFKAAKNKTIINKEDEMVWCVLMEKLNLPVSANFIDHEKSLYEDTKNKMSLHCEQICGKRPEEVAEQETPIDLSMHCSENCPRVKRDLSPRDPQSGPSSKKLKSDDCQSQDENFLDVLKQEVEYIAYEEIFKKFSFIKRAESFAQPDRKLNLKFDIFPPKTSFKRTEDLPTYRLLIIKTTDNFPTNAELEFMRQQQHFKLPIIIAIVSESMTIHFCVCTF